MSHTAKMEIQALSTYIYRNNQNNKSFLISNVKNNFICNLYYVLLNILKVKTCNLVLKKN
jgi:hypothetical protein